jgi:hypothetical protein
MTEAQLRKMIRKEVLKEMANMKPEKEDVFSDFKDPMKVGAGVGLAVGANALMAYLQAHPEVTKPIMDLLKALGNAVQE